ncbi:MAG: endonuclease domain-containing protein [Candidatus Margulisbacteria bacterium]|nr:endonuclease domain-containing protein [Candidatus Margulisiibacteriota bacterium]
MRRRDSKFVKETVRKLRREQTEAEEIFWKIVRNRSLDDKKFLRQHPVVFTWRGRQRFFVADFYCHEAGLIVELDGGIHDKRKNYDKARDYALESMGFRVIRFKNSEVMDDVAGVLGRLREVVNSPQTPFLTPRQSSGQAREGLQRYLTGHSPSLSKRGGYRG